MKTKLTQYIQVVSAITIVMVYSCKKFVQVPSPINQIISKTAFSDDASATATINGIYSAMMSTPSDLCSSMLSLYGSLSADELTYFTTSSKDGFVQNTISQSNDNDLILLWAPTYNYIYSANSCLNGVANSTTLSDPVKADINGEAYFIRAFMYFNLVNLFGDVPKITSTDYTINKSAQRTPVNEIYQLIIADLLKAQTLLKNDYPSVGRARPNRATVQALLAKVYLYQKDWLNTQRLCDSIILNPTYKLEPDPNNVFLASSQEAIWQLAPVTANFNTYIGNLILPASTTTVPTYVVTPSLLNDFEPSDKRKAAWLNSRVYKSQTLYYPYKYKIRTGATVTEYNMVFRLAEIFLMRAEAKAQQGDLSGAISDVNIIRSRAGLAGINPSVNQGDLLNLIQHERRIELFSEWGNRWFDLKRTNSANSILGNLKPTWKPTAALYPIPYSEILINTALKQNDGY